MVITLISLAVILLVCLAFYAGQLLFRLKKQNLARRKKTQVRLDDISQSIQTIAKATNQGQCDMSEACIRIYHLLEALPLLNKPDFAKQYSSLYKLYDEIRDLPTHQARKEQSKIDTRKQDIHREMLEAKLRPQLLHEISELTRFSVKDF
ncbi:DUF2489 domain-containing protein [Paraglaciecola aquimarina]|uniref:DUF2489 domain-containing protein n=1 Tax=Paraglaciecola algarum TaxID=3050085 RepID=A0ABS9D2N9_9ALTE|nr:DUF2489 domain-containing protein [Paraglaciecola sp. G1-23]MCF2947191.1 DUF2489 domain-containing protein [Paraglaciecola sp. G1-23]